LLSFLHIALHCTLQHTSLQQSNFSLIHIYISFHKQKSDEIFPPHCPRFEAFAVVVVVCRLAAAANDQPLHSVAERLAGPSLLGRRQQGRCQEEGEPILSISADLPPILASHGSMVARIFN
jgi:hypothetical protein